MLYVVVLYQVQKLRCSVVFYKQRVEGLEERLSAALGNPVSRQAAASRAVETSRAPEPETPTPEATQQKVLHLHGLGRSREEIARQAGIREAEVDFVLKVSEHVGTPGAALALRKIS
jgi:DNA-binding NarL/FixJ family response regulator